MSEWGMENVRVVSVCVLVLLSSSLFSSTSVFFFSSNFAHVDAHLFVCVNKPPDKHQDRKRRRLRLAPVERKSNKKARCASIISTDADDTVSQQVACYLCALTAHTHTKSDSLHKEHDDDDDDACERQKYVCLSRSLEEAQAREREKKIEQMIKHLVFCASSKRD